MVWENLNYNYYTSITSKSLKWIEPVYGRTLIIWKQNFKIVKEVIDLVKIVIRKLTIIFTKPQELIQ